MHRLAILALLGCQDVKEIGGGAGLDLTWVPGVGQVFECDVSDGHTLELCFDGEADELALSLTENGFGAAICGATPRHLGPCAFHCPSEKGCNALSGCWCEEIQ